VNENPWSLAPGGTPVFTAKPSELCPKKISPFGCASLKNEKNNDIN